MRILLLCSLLTLGGCGSFGDTVGEIIREKKYNIQVNQTPNSKQMFGYNDDYDYIGFMVEGQFH